MKKKTIPFSDSKSEKKFIKDLKNGQPEVKAALKDYYFSWIKRLLQGLISLNEPLDSIIDAICETIIKQAPQIKNRNTLTKIVFHEARRAFSTRCFTHRLHDFNKNMKALKKIFLQIEKLNETHKEVVRMFFQQKNINQIKAELRKPIDTLEQYAFEGCLDISDAIKKQDPTSAQIFREEIVDFMFSKETVAARHRIN